MLGTKTARRGVALVAMAAVLAMPIGLAPANAEPDYPPVFYQISASSYTSSVGGKVTFTAQTFAAGSVVDVDVSVDGDSVGSGNANANRKGVAVTDVTFTVVGVNRVTMSGTSDTGEDLSLSADVTVTAADDDVVPVDDNNGGSGDDANAGGGVPFLGGGLPRTGGEIAATVLVAVALLGAGFLLVIATRRRRESH